MKPGVDICCNQGVGSLSSFGYLALISEASLFNNVPSCAWSGSQAPSLSLVVASLLFLDLGRGWTLSSTDIRSSFRRTSEEQSLHLDTDYLAFSVFVVLCLALLELVR